MFNEWYINICMLLLEKIAEDMRLEDASWDVDGDDKARELAEQIADLPNEERVVAIRFLDYLEGLNDEEVEDALRCIASDGRRLSESFESDGNVLAEGFGDWAKRQWERIKGGTKRILRGIGLGIRYILEHPSVLVSLAMIAAGIYGYVQLTSAEEAIHDKIAKIKEFLLGHVPDWPEELGPANPKELDHRMKGLGTWTPPKNPVYVGAGERARARRMRGY